ncbi:D-alanyl-glycyl endopeptidase-like protein [Leishmania tarentolae]|uniref:D-alanyl-glycyl endopeptidase-like protein n=1 Tax=Leishmania tarentolae TaxID=5689 RepID=A0A640KR92_LEITA|nr:D-alanyl-glycyl endopeptidase-like protein [Leishmania tarentolae]
MLEAMRKCTSSTELLPVEPSSNLSTLTADPFPAKVSQKNPAGSPMSHNHDRMQQDYWVSDATPGPPPAVSAPSAENDGVFVSQSLSDGDITSPPNNCSNIHSESAQIRACDNKSADGRIAGSAHRRWFVLTHNALLHGIIKWSLAILLLLFLAFIVFGMLYSSIRYGGSCSGTSDGAGKPTGPCATPFGSILGVSNGVFGYSNCNDSYVSTKKRYINVTVPKVNNETGQLTYTSEEFYTGLEWQCVEYARRYWMQNGVPQPAYFESVEGAADIWNLTFVRSLSNKSTRLPLHKYRNGGVMTDILQRPTIGDIIIYPIQDGGFPYGHVAVIVKVEIAREGFVYVAEQNWANGVWSSVHHNYTRRIPLLYDSLTSVITLDDPHGKIMGWMRYG